MFAVFDDQFGGQGWPVVGMEVGAAEEGVEPFPFSVGQVEAGCMEADPGAAAVGVAFEGGALLVGMRRVVQPEDDVVVGQVVVVQVSPVGGGVEGEVLLAGDEVKEVKGVLREIDMVHFSLGGVKGGYFEAGLLGMGGKRIYYIE